ncbi:MAG: type II toxin-antitoxin system HicB family antitoxin [Bacteroidales bacterium]|nr:type II toxin-antitoxin system HicB family antitoxin [Bacteroidales bacterium]
MEKNININIKRLEEGYYLATSDNFHEMVAKGKTIFEALEAAKVEIKRLLKV